MKNFLSKVTTNYSANWILIAIFYMLNILDLASTHIVLALGGGELNPIVNYLLDLHGVSALYITKAAVLTPLSIVLYIKRSAVPTMPRGILLGCTIVFLLTIINNFIVIAHLL